MGVLDQIQVPKVRFVKSTFLHGDLYKNFYIDQSLVFEQESLICMSNKSLHGLTQAPRARKILMTYFSPMGS